MTMASVAVTQGNPGNSSAMINPKRYNHQLQSGIITTNSASTSYTSASTSGQNSSSPTSAKNYDTISKGKKSWSVRLGLSRQGNNNNITEDVPKQGWGTISGGSALSRQMRYGDPWLYGTVRGHRHNVIQDPRIISSPCSPLSSSSSSSPSPQHQHHHHQQQQQGYKIPIRQSPTPIIVVCSCPEFLSGTTRKLGNCKKCGGHRLAGLPLGGTCRVPQTSSRLRPSLAGVLRQPLDDPYDLVRRSRLVEPRSRARSTSPHRLGINQRSTGLNGLTSGSSVADTSRSHIVAINNNHQRTEWFNVNNDEWFEQSLNERRSSRNNSSSSSSSNSTSLNNNNSNNNSNNNNNNNCRKKTVNLKRDIDPRKSILECDVNPYLLVKKKQQEQQKPKQKQEEQTNYEEDDDFSDDLSDNALESDDHFIPTLFDPSKVKSIDRLPARCSVAAIGGQRIRVFNEPREISEPEDDEDDEEDEEGGGDDDNENEEAEEEKVKKEEEEEEVLINDKRKYNKEFVDRVAIDKNIKVNNCLSLISSTNIPIPKVSPKRPPRKQKIDTKFIAVKSILKKSKSNQNKFNHHNNNNSIINNKVKKKRVLFNVDNVIFAPARSEFIRSKDNFGEKLKKEEEEEEEEEEKEEEEMEKEIDKVAINTIDDMVDKRPKFITIPNIKDLKPNEIVYNNKIQSPLINNNNNNKNNNTRNNKLLTNSSVVVARTSCIPKIIGNNNNNNNNKSDVIATSNASDETLKEVKLIENNQIIDQLGIINCEDKTITDVILNKIKEDSTNKETLKNYQTEEQQSAENTDTTKRPSLQRSQSERITGNLEIVENVPFTDTMRLSVRKRHTISTKVVDTDLIEDDKINETVTTTVDCETFDTNYEELNLTENYKTSDYNFDNFHKDKTNVEHFRRMRPTSWSPPPLKNNNKNLPQNRSSDPGTIDFKPPVFQTSNIVKTSSSSMNSKNCENVFKITVSPLQSPLVHRLQIGSSEINNGGNGGGAGGGGGRRTSILINGDQNLNSETSYDNKVTISVGGEDSVCNPTVISVNSDVPPKIKSTSENRTLVILDNYSSNIIVEPSLKDDKITLRNNRYDSENNSSSTMTTRIMENKGKSLKYDDDVQLRKSDDISDKKNTNLTKEAVVSRILEDSLKKARRNGEILDESSGEAILKILKQTLLKSVNSTDYESSDSTVEPDNNYSRSSSINSEVDFIAGNIYVEENPYEVIKEPIYEEIPDELPPPLPLSPPPTINENYNKDQIYFGDEYKEANYYKKFNSYFPVDYFKTKNPEESNNVDDEQFVKKNNSPTGDNYSSKFELLNYLIDSKDRTSLVEEEEEEDEEEDDEEEDAEGEIEALYEQKETSLDDLSSKSSQISNVSDSSEEGNVAPITSSSPETLKMRTVDIERTDSGVGSESSQASSRRGAIRRRREGTNAVSNSSGPASIIANMPQVVSGDVKLCHDCEQRLDPLVTISGVVYAPFVCRKCAKKRSERKEIIMEIVETERKYGRDLQIILEEFHRPMFRAGLLTQDQLSAIFLNVEELLEHNVILADKLRDAVEYAQEAGDEDLVTMDVGKIFLESEGMLHAFESYCTRQGSASLLLQNLEKEKELLRIFLKVSQMENTVLRRMNLNSFLMVPVQRVTKYPLLLARLYKATPSVRPDIQIAKNKLKQAQTNIELHLEHMNAEAKDVTSTKLWRRISIIQNGRRSMGEQDMVNIKLRKMAVEVLEWAHEEVRFALEGRLLVALPTDNNWRRGKTVKLVPVTAMLVTNGKPNTQFLELADDSLFPRQIGVKEATLLLVKEKIGRYSLLREPLYLDKCIVCCEADLEDYFEIQELSSKETFIFKAEDGVRTKRWCRTLQAHAQSLGAWRRRRGALANIMICGVARN